VEEAMKKPLRELGNPIRRGTGLLLTLSFFLGVVALALHHHHVSFPLKTCAICKAKISMAGTLSKVKADHPLTVTVNHGCGDVTLTVSLIRYDHQTPVAAPPLCHRLSNKAPPAIS
jgi:hypothetical protein